MGLAEDIREVVEELLRSEGRIKSETHVTELLAKLHRSDKDEEKSSTGSKKT